MKFFLFLFLLSGFAAPLAQAKTREEKIERELYNEGFYGDQNNVDGLLGMIWRNEGWSGVRENPYYNLHRFAPYTVSTAKRILDLVATCLSGRKPKEGCNYMLLLHPFSTHRVLAAATRDRMQVLMTNRKPPLDVRRLLANVLIRYRDNQEAAAKVLNNIIKTEEAPSIRLMAAMDLYYADLSNAEVEGIMQQAAGDPELSVLIHMRREAHRVQACERNFGGKPSETN